MAAIGAIRVLCVALIAMFVRGQTNCGNCNTTGHGVGCNVRSLQECICPVDTFCCAVAWDFICVAEVFSICGVDCSGLGQCPYEMDGNLEVLFPPLIDEDETHVEFNGASTNMKITILVPKQYSTAKFDFEGATNPTGAYDSTNNTYNSPFWLVDALTDPCNKIYHGYIPWLDFRTSLGGINERRFPDAVYYDTAINIEVTKNLTLSPETLLLENADAAPMQAQEHVRYVRNKIPFEIKFDLALKLWSSVAVRSDHLRVAAAIVDSTVLNVDPDYVPIAKAQLDFVTVIPLPLILTSPTITVDVPALGNGITIEELVPLRNCTESQEICTQYWHIMVYPEQCTLNGQYIANLTGICHPDSVNCIPPEPDYTEIVMDVTSDDYCGITQEVDIVGSLVLEATDCNGYLRGTVQVSNPDGGAINHTEIMKVDVSPTLLDSQFLTVYDNPNAILNYTAVLTQPDQVDFQFIWRGSELRCDVIASVDVMVAVEFEATRSLQILSLTANAGTELQAKTPNTHKRNVLQQQVVDEYDMRMLSHAMVSADDGVSPDDSSDVGDATGTGGDAATSSSTTLVAVVVLAALVVAICACGGAMFVRARREKQAHPDHAAAAAIGMSPRNTKHKRTISQAVMSRMRAVDEAERTPLHTPGANGQFFHDE